MEYDYQEIIDKCKELGIYSDIPVFDFRDKQLSEELNFIFNFYQSNIVKHYHYGIEPGVFVFADDLSMNAGGNKI